jgi:hypothetical protein
MSLREQHPDLLKEVDIDEQERWMTPLVNKVAMGHRPQGVMDRCIIRDDTLRSGINTPGVYANNNIKMVLAEKLEAMGVVEAEVGYPTIPEHIEFVKMLRSAGNKMELGLHTRYYDPDYRTEIQKTIDSGADLVNLVGYWGYIMTNALCPQNWNGDIEGRIGDAVSHARQSGARKIAVGTDYHRLDLVARVVRARERMRVRTVLSSMTCAAGSCRKRWPSLSAMSARWQGRISKIGVHCPRRLWPRHHQLDRGDPRRRADLRRHHQLHRPSLRKCSLRASRAGAGIALQHPHRSRHDPVDAAERDGGRALQVPHCPQSPRSPARTCIPMAAAIWAASCAASGTSGRTSRPRPSATGVRCRSARRRCDAARPRRSPSRSNRWA